MKKSLYILLLILLLITPLLVAQSNETDLIYFTQIGCIHCAKLELFLNEIKNKYPTLNSTEYEIHTSNNWELFEKFSKAYNFDIKKTGTPTIFIDKKIIIGFNNEKRKEIEQELIRCTKEQCISPLTQIDNSDLTKQTITISAVISAAVVDSINPCEFAVLIILLTTILATQNKKKALLAGLAFSLSIYISYLLMGLGLFSALKASGLTHYIYIISSMLAIILGLFNLKDYFWYGKLFIMEVPLSWRPILKATLKKITSVAGAFLIGFIISLFLLPCTSGPYIVILGLLSKTATHNYALMLLLLYNLIFILPMLIITFLIYLGFTTTEKAEEWRTNKLKILHLIAGILLLLIGIGMLIAISKGAV